MEVSNSTGNTLVDMITLGGQSYFISGGLQKLATTSAGVSVTGDINQGAILQEQRTGRIGFNRNTTNGVIHDANYNAFQFNGATVSGVNGKFEIQSYNQSGVFGGSITISKTSDLTTSSQVFSAATSSGDASSTLTTKGYVDGLITGATIYRGAWDPSGGGYGSPDLSGVTQTSGYYYICSAAGTAEPNGTGTEPDTWAVGDWVIYNDVSGTGQWQKIDNSSVLSGVGTGQTVALWEGAGSVTDSETLGNAPITVSGNDTTFGGNITTSGTNATVFADRFSGLGVGAVIGPNGAGTVFLRPSGVGSSTNQSSFTTTLATIGTDATFAGDVVINSAGDATSPILRLNNSSSNTFNHALEAINDNLTAAQTELLLFGKETNNRNSGFIGYNWNADNSETNYVTIGHWGYNHLLKIYPTGTATFVGAVTSPTFLGDLNGTINTATTGVTQTAGDNSTLIATTAYADAAAAAVPIGNYLPLAGGTMTGVTQFNDHTNYGDQVYARFGASQDLQIFHNGTDSFIDNYTGSLTIRNRQDDGNIVFTCDDGSGGLASYLTLNGNSTHAYFTNPGNVGIGTTSPSYKLHVNGGDAQIANGSTATLYMNNSANYLYGDVNGVGIVAAGNNFRVKTNNSERLRIIQNGNIGIGTTSPGTKLHISGNSALNDTSTQSLLRLERPFSSGVSFAQGGDIAIGRGTTYPSTQMRFILDNGTNNPANPQATIMALDSSGNVGIGTTSPDNLLHVQGSNNPRIDLGEDTNNKGWMRWNNADNYIDFTTRVGGTYYADTLVLRNGNVGIGTTNPAQNFVVSNSTNGQGIEIIPGTTGTIQAYNRGTSVYVPLNIDTLEARVRSIGATVFNNGSGFSESMRITSTGNVGIGATSPGAKLDVNGDVLIKSGEYISWGTVGATSIEGSTASNKLQFRTNSSDRMIIDSTGRVGIGTTSPGAKLEVKSTTAIAYNPSTYNSGSILTLKSPNANTNYSSIRFSNSAGNYEKFIGSVQTGTNTADIVFQGFDRGAGIYKEYARIAENGNVGIGTSTPNAKLDVQGTQGQLFSVTDDLSGDIFSVADISGVPIMSVNSDGTSYFDGNVGIGTTDPGYRLEVDGGIGDGVKIKAGNAASKDSLLVSTNNDVSKFLVQGDGKVIINSSTGISGRTENFQVFGKQIITNTGTDGPVLYLGYNSSGSNTIQLGRGRTADGLSYMDFNGEVMSAGQFGFRIIRYSGQNASTELNHIGTGAFKLTCTNSADIILNPNSGSVGISQTNPSHKLDVTGDGRFTSTVTATNFILSSDERLKENVEKVCDNRVEADWKTFELKTEKGQKRYGVIAQELEKTNPEFVREDSQGFKSVAYIDLLIAKIAELEARLEKLEK